MKRLAALLLALTAAGCDRAAGSAAAPPAAAAPAAAQAALPAGEWPTYHGSFSLEGVAPGTLPDAPKRLWKIEAGNRVETTPVSSGGRIYFPSVRGGLHAVGLDGKPVWKLDLGKDKGFSSPLLACDGLVIAGSQGGTLVAYDAATGKEAWSYDLGGTVQGTPNRVDSGGKKAVVAISQGDGCIHAVDLSTGKMLWKTEPVERCDGSPGVGNGLVIMGSCASALHLFSIEKAAKQADVPLGGECQVAGGVAISGTTAFAGSRGGKFFAVDTANAKILWSNEDSKREAFTTPAVTEKIVVFGSEEGKLYALKRDSGGRLWDFDAKDAPKSPVVAGNRVAFSAGGTLYLLDLETGKKLWSEKVSDEITSPAIIGGRIVVGSDDGCVYAYGKE